MLNLPKTTEFNKRIPKQKFYENLSITPALKRIFVEQIHVIYWRNKIATSTINLSKGDYVEEIEVFEIQLTVPSLDETILKQIDKAIPYHIVYIATYQDQQQIWIGYKDNNKTIKHYYHTEWLKEDKIHLQLKGLNLDDVYENYVRQIAGNQLEGSNQPLKESIEIAERKQELQKQIDKLAKKIRNEKQLNRQVEMNDELKKLKSLLLNDKESYE